MPSAFSRSERRLFVVCTCLIGVILGTAVFINAINREPDLALPPAPVPPQPNGYDLYVKAEKAMRHFNPPADPASDPQVVTDPKVIAQRYGLPRREKWLKANRAAFALFHQAQNTSCAFPVNREYPESNLGSYQQLRQLARDKAAECRTFQMRSDWDRALGSGLDVMQMASDIDRGGPLIPWLVMAALDSIAAASVADTPAHVSAEAARKGIRRLETLNKRQWTLQQAVEEDTRTSLVLIQKSMRTGAWRNPVQYTESNEPISLGDRWRSLTVSKQAVVDSVRRIGEAAQKEVVQPYLTPTVSFPEPAHPLARTWKRDSFERLRFIRARHDATIHLFLLRLALRAYFVEHGRYPQRLQELAPGYLTEVPPDAFGDGKLPYSYQPAPQSFKLWSIGPDGKDNHGTPPAKNPKRKFPLALPDMKGDLVIGP
jgi:hypothetical protein